jgi:hypothetical protein
MHMDRQADRHNEANGHFSKFSEHALNKKWHPRVFPHSTVLPLHDKNVIITHKIKM